LVDMNMCDKCQRRVSPDNDCARFDWLLGAALAFMSQSRHLLPVVENGVVVCGGSPSRAQYIDGQPRDPRPEWSYMPEREAPYRAAYDQLLADAAEIAAQ